MSFNENLLKYARLIVKAGVNVQKGQIVVIDAPVENAKLARMIAKKLILLGQVK
ncbi:aminopeptidase [Coprobacillaceae bacterium CR2/5/TPMF4]|nr:aminopeptidase [Coprobacillaceae bacterium CR2/5/TPMF4]